MRINYCRFKKERSHLVETTRPVQATWFRAEIGLPREQPKVGKKDIPAKDKSMAIYMVQLWHRMTRQKVTQSFAHISKITFPPLTTNSGTEGLLVIEAEISGHMVHRIRETIWPLGKLRLLVTVGDAEHSTKAWMNFMIVRSLSTYNGIIRRPRIREIQALPSTAHGMLKFPVDEGIENLDIFAWQLSDMTRVSRSVAEHRLNIREGYSPVRQKKRGQALERAKAIHTEVQKLVEIVIMKEVYYHDWLSNSVMVKKHEGSWRMCMDFTDLDKACSQDCYPLPEIDWKVESLCGYPFKYFVDAYKGYHQIQMAESDKEKMAFHTSHEVYCYTKMTFSLKNVSATYQWLVEKAFDSQVGQNIEVYVDDLVIKSHTETRMLRDIDETFRTL
ncbi:reverse transcriptase domain-containing protein [Tanacetum coccineum]